MKQIKKVVLLAVLLAALLAQPAHAQSNALNLPLAPYEMRFWFTDPELETVVDEAEADVNEREGQTLVYNSPLCVESEASVPEQTRWAFCVQYMTEKYAASYWYDGSIGMQWVLLMALPYSESGTSQVTIPNGEVVVVCFAGKPCANGGAGYIER